MFLHSLLLVSNVIKLCALILFLKNRKQDFINETKRTILHLDIFCISLVIAVDKLKFKKAVGIDAIDGIQSEFIKFAKDKLTGPMHGVFNFLFSKGDWSEGLINPIHKKGSRNIEDNYRKVTVMPALGKVFESILNSRFTYTHCA